MKINSLSICKPHLVLTALALAIAPVSQTMAQLMLEEVIVTAQKREQSLQDVPISVSAMSGEKINDNGIVDLEELALNIPNFNINKGQASPNLFIRGVGSGTNAGFEQSVGLYIDGIYSGRAQLAAVPLTLDLQRVEVLKGPQAILFGKNTIGGAVNITSARPDHEFDAYAEALYAPEDGEQIYTGVINGSITDSLAGRLAIRYEGMDGWWDNETLNEEGPDKDNLYIRASLLWDAADNVEVLAKYETGDFETANRPFVIYQSDQPVNFQGDEPIPFTSDRDKGASNLAAVDKAETDVFALTVNWDLDFATVTSVTGYASYELAAVSDTDFSTVAALQRTLDEEYDQFSQELRLVSPGGEALDWIVGAYYQQAELDVSRVNTDLDFALLGPISVAALVGLGLEAQPSLFEQESNSWAVFAQGTWNFTDTVRMGVGVRYNEETKDLDKVTRSQGLLGARAATSGPAANFIVQANPASGVLIGDVRSHDFRGLSRDEDAFTFSGNLQWDPTDSAMLYATVSTGFKGGGFDEAYTGAGSTVRTGSVATGEPDGGVIQTGIDGSILEYDDETVLAYEIGAKMTLADGAANLNIAIFRMEYEDLQVSSLVGDIFQVGNAGEAISQGIEIDGRWMLAEGFIVGGAMAYLDATYDAFDGATCTIPQSTDPSNNPGCLAADGSGNITAPGAGGQDLSGETLLFAPEWSYNINATWIIPLSGDLEIRTNADVNYTDEFYSALDLDPNTLHDSVVRVNARIALATIDDKWSIALVGKNLTDEESRVWNNDVPTTASNSYFGVPERPRSLAIQARYRF
ncbi:MAG: outer membrane receptor protein involved in Fe transport [Alcanivorax sp.]|jgi:outer membrane receptor protein involved in Fe transport